MLKDLIYKLTQHNNLTQKECYNAMLQMSRELIPEQAAAFFSLLHAKQETSEELLGFISALKEQSIYFETDFDCLDIVGTGGDRSQSVNISTAVSLITASLGIHTAKHGNRAVSSRSGSADFVEALGIPLDHCPIKAKQILQDTCFTFLFAPNFHPALTKFKTFRQSLGIPTMFNLVGPLLNPAKPSYYLMGVYNKRLLRIFSELLLQMDIKRALVVHSQGLDEVSLIGTTDVIEINGTTLTEYCIDPQEYGFRYHPVEAIQGGNANNNVELIKKALSSKSGAIHDTLILNAGCAIYASDNAKTIAEGIEIAREQIHSCQALHYIQQLSRVNYA